MTFYLKYRPKTVEELDLASVRERLSAAVKGKHFAHAYLFHGPKGTGKTSSARIIAREIGAAPEDIIELDAASNRGIDDVRQLRERIAVAPMAGAKTAYIIDEVHMLTTEAFNALLKTLEEPPDHVVFFLCTTELEKVPATVSSRCVSIQFSKATDEEVMRSLRRVVRSEKTDIGDDALRSIANHSGGSFRDAHKLLEQVVAATPKGRVSVADVERISGGTAGQDVLEYVDAVVKGNSEAALSAISRVETRGGDMEWFSRQILMALRDRLLNGPSSRLLLATRVVEERTRTVKFSLIPQLPLEIAALELARDREAGKEESGEKGKNQDSEKRKGETMLKPGPVREHDRSMGDASSGSPAAGVPPVGGRGAGERQDPKKEEVSDSAMPSSAPLASISLEQVKEKWPSILERVREKNHGIVTLLAHCTPKDLSGRSVTIETKYQFHREQLGQDRFRTMLQQAFVDVLGTLVVPRFVLGEQTTRVLHSFVSDDNIRAAGDDEFIRSAEEIFS